MQFNLNQAGLLSAFLTALVLLAFSLVVGALCRFRGPGRWYALFGVGFSLAAALSHLSSALFDIQLTTTTLVPAADGPDAATYWASLWLNVASGLATALWTWGAIRLLDCYGGRPFRWIGWTATGLVLAINVFGAWSGTLVEADGLWITVTNLTGMSYLVPVAWMGAAGLIMALARGQEARRGQAILASALSAYPITWAAWSTFAALPFSTLAAAGLLVISLGSFAALQFGWLRLRLRGGGREAIAVTVVGDVFLILGLAMGVLSPNESPSSIARVYDVVLVAYAILRLQYLDLDIKVRFGLSKGTVAGVVVAVVFVVSEGAQSLFGEDKQWLGLVVGGLVVFAIAPLQRAADRLAERAVPTTRPQAGRNAAEEIYWEAVQAASRDGRVTTREELHLARIADRLGIGSERALELRTASRPQRL